MIKLAMVGEGAIADVHMASLAEFKDVKVTTLVCGLQADGARFAQKWNIGRVAQEIDAIAGDATVDGVIIASPSGYHAAQAEAIIRAGKHTLVEIPMALCLEDSIKLGKIAENSSKVVMVGHTRRFSPAHRHLRENIKAGCFRLQHLVAETYFFRRTNSNIHGVPRSWTDSLLWHHACHSIDLFIWLTGDASPAGVIQAGPPHETLGIPMDMSIGLKSQTGAIMTLALSFNNQGPFGGFYRYIGDTGTFHVFRDQLSNHERTDMPLAGTAAHNLINAFVDAIRTGRDPEASITSCLPAMTVIAKLADQLE